MNNTILIIDANNLAYRAHYKFNLTTNDGTPSGVAYGFLYILNSLIRKFSPSEVHTVFDGGRSPLRLEIWPDYKKRDDKLGEDRSSFYEQISDLQSVLPDLGCRVYREPQVEADDIIYQVYRFYEGTRKNIVSSDKDFVQILDPYTKILNPFKDLIISTINIKKEYGFTEKEIVDYLILKGDKSDNIPGIKGMGEKRIRDFLDTYGSIENFLENNTLYLNRYDIAPVYIRNRKLINLSWHYTHSNSRTAPVYKSYQGLPKDFLRKYELRSFIKSEFTDVFKNL